MAALSLLNFFLAAMAAPAYSTSLGDSATKLGLPDYGGDREGRLKGSISLFSF